MIYTKKTKASMRMAFFLHEMQVDKNNVPYIYHPIHVAEQMDDEDSTIVALLHDILEDTEVVADELQGLIGFSDEVGQAIACLTHKKGTPYMDYIKVVSENPLATKVKLADLEHNMDLSRLDEVTEKDIQRTEKYKKARDFLISVCNKEIK